MPHGASPEPVERPYLGAIGDLERLATADYQVTPVTAMLTHNLAIIDSAIAEDRAAVASEPYNTVAQSHLRAGLRRKVAMLQTADAATSRPW